MKIKHNIGLLLRKHINRDQNLWKRQMRMSQSRCQEKQLLFCKTCKQSSMEERQANYADFSLRTRNKQLTIPATCCWYLFLIKILYVVTFFWFNFLCWSRFPPLLPRVIKDDIQMSILQQNSRCAHSMEYGHNTRQPHIMEIVLY